MIDCHVHAFSGFRSSAGDLLDRAAEKAGQDSPIGGSLAGLASLVRNVGAPPVPSLAFDVARLLGPDLPARLRKQVPPELYGLVDMVGSLVAAPQVLAWGTIEGLLASMDRAAISQSVLIAAAPLAPNEWVLGEAGVKGQGRIIPVAALPAMAPDTTEEQWAEKLTGLADAGARGFKIHVNMDNLPPDHVAYRTAFAIAKERGLPIIIHTGRFDVPGYKRPGPVEPSMFHPLLESFPEVRVCLAHMNRDTPEAAWETMVRFEQVYADTSWQPAEVIARAAERVGTERLLLGSDWPLLHTGMQGAAVDALRIGLGEETAQRVGDENARRFFGIPL